MIVDTTKPRNPITPFYCTDRGKNKRGIITFCIKDAEIGCGKCIFHKSCLLGKGY